MAAKRKSTIGGQLEVLELLQNDDRFRQLFANSSAGISITEHDRRTGARRLITCNDRFVEMSGRSRDELLSAEDLRAYVHDVGPSGRPDVISSLAEGKTVSGIAAWYRPDGRENYYEYKALLLDERDGKLLVLGIDEDASHRPRAQLEGQLQDRLFQKIVHNSSDGINVVEVDVKTRARRLLFCNDRFVEMSGYTRRQLMECEDLNELVVNVYDPSPDHIHKIRQGEPHQGLASWKRPDGKANVYEYRTALIENRGEKLLVMGIDRDVTQQRRDEQALRLHSEVLKNLDEGVCLVRADDERIIYANRRLGEIFQVEPQEILGKHYSALSSRTDGIDRRTVARAKAALKKNGTWGGELRWLGDDGRQTWLRLNISSFQDLEHGHVWIALVQDVTQHRDALEQFKRQNELFTKLLEHSPDGICIAGFDPVTRRRWVIDCNDRFCEMIGRSRQEVLAAKDLRQFTREVEIPEGYPNVQLTADRAGRGVGSWVRPDGAENYHEYVTAVVGQTGSDWLVVTIDRDITPRRKFERALRESNQLLEKTFASLREAVFIIDNDTTKIVNCNPAASEIFGYSREEMLGRTTEFLHVDAAALARFREVLFPAVQKHGRLDGFEFHMRRKDGSIFPTEHSVVPLLDEHGNRTAWVSVVRDISQRLEAQRAVRESERRYRQLFEVSPDGLVVHVDGRIEMINPAAAKLLGPAEPQELIGADALQFVHPDDLPKVRRRIAKLERGRNVAFTELRIIGRDGSERIVESGAIPFIYRSRPAVMSIFHDITQRKRDEQALREQDELIRQIFNCSRDGINICLKDPKTGRRKLVLCNDRFVQMSGRTLEELQAAEDLNDFVISIEEPPEPLVRKRLQNGITVLGTGAWKRPDGKENYYEYTATVLGERDGQLLVMGIDRDVTERKKTQDALKESHELFRKLLDHTNDGINIVELSPDGKTRRLVLCNDRFVEMSGRTRQELMNAPNLNVFLDPLFVPPPGFVERLRRGLPCSGIGAWKRPDGKWNRYEFTASKIGMRGENLLVIGIDRDIGERERMEEQLRQAAKMEAIGKLAGGIAHDFNNQLTVVKGYCDLLLKDLGGNNPIRNQLEEIQKAAERAEALTSQLLAFSRRQILSPRIVNLNAILNGLAGPLSHMISEDIKLSMVLGENLGNVRTDPSQLEQAVMNLVVNASDAMPRGGVLTIQTANIDLDDEYVRRNPGAKPGPHVMLAVADTGVGMDDETMKHIFEPFFTTKGVGEGTGLGLPMVYGFVRQSDGHIRVDSAPGKGSTFRIYLPRVDQPVSMPDQPRVIHREPRGSETVLIAEDEDSVRQLLAGALNQYGYNVLQASSPKEALPLGKHYDGQIDLLISDVIMPGMSGPELAELLADARPDMKVLYISGYAERTIMERRNMRIPAQMLSKPFTPEQLVRKVRDVLDAR